VGEKKSIRSRSANIGLQVILKTRPLRQSVALCTDNQT